MNTAEFIRKIKRIANEKGVLVRIENRGKGAHHTLYLGGSYTIISKHGRCEIATGTYHRMLKQLGLTPEDME